jgi:crotonobetainyl-CoA:carnitine CoA-transferase CaiB-like acyl-CoA transferase
MRAGAGGAAVKPKERNGLPLNGVRVVEFTHMVMGPTCGMILADLGADVIKVEPIKGDKTRKLPGVGAGFFRTFNRGKRSLALNLASPEGLAVTRKLVAKADVVSENFKPGRMDDLGLGYEELRKTNPRLIYVSHKGFLPGPYDNRTALDEVVQMMGGLAYMTGPPGRPLRVGTSVNDIMGGMWGVIGVLAALIERSCTGEGQHIQSSLFENCAFLSAQHMQQFAVTGEPPSPMPVRKTAYAVYDTFQTADHKPLFIGAVSDGQWQALCTMLDLPELLADPQLKSNADRVASRSRFMPILERTVANWTLEALAAVLEKNGLPFAPVNRPEELFDDPHLLASGGLGRITTETGEQTLIPVLPLMLGKRRLGGEASLPAIGNATTDVLSELGYSSAEIAALIGHEIVAVPTNAKRAS